MQTQKILRGALPLAIFFLLISFVAAANTDANYTEVGTLNRNFNLGYGIFNTQLDEYDTYTRAVSSPLYVPFVSDLDGDGEADIIVFDGTSMRLFKDETLDTVDSITLRNALYSPPVIRDFDRDGLVEVAIFYPTLENVTFYNYNGSLLYEVKSHKFSGSATGGDEETSFMGCDEDNVCAVVWDTTNSNVGYLHIGVFNYSDVGNRVIAISTSSDERNCLPYLPHFGIADADADGLTDWFFTAYFVDDGVSSAEATKLLRCEKTSLLNLNATCSTIFSESMGDTFCGGSCGTGWSCEQTHGAGEVDAPAQITSPALLDFDGSVSNGVELVFGFKPSQTTMRMKAISYLGVERDSFPSLGATTKATYMSNPVIMDALDDTGAEDVCIMLYYEAESFQDLMCGSMVTGKYSLSGGTQFDLVDYPINITPDYNTWHHMLHATQHNSSTIDGNNPDEVINTFGIYARIGNEASLSGLGGLTRIWENPHQESAGYSIDASKIGIADIIFLDDTNLWYYDDTIANQDCSDQNCITSYFINPCLDSVWKNGTNVEIRITVEDDNGFTLGSDDVSARAILYYDSIYEQASDWQTNASSGTTFTFHDFEVNATITGSAIRLQARETGNYNVIESIDLPFSVGINGVEYNDCTTDIDIGVAVADDETATDIDDNIIQSGMGAVNNFTGLGYSVIWLLILGAFCVWMIMQMGNIANITAGMVYGILSVTVLVFFIGLWVGVKLEYIGTGVFISFIVMGIIGVALITMRTLHGGN